MQSPAYHKSWIFSSKGGCLNTVRTITEEAGNACGFSAADIYAMKVAVSEACANAIEHGSPKGESDTFEFEVSCSNDELQIRIKDNGVFKARSATEGAHLSTRGRGIYLMMALMDSVKLEESENGTMVLMTRKKTPDNNS